MKPRLLILFVFGSMLWLFSSTLQQGVLPLLGTRQLREYECTNDATKLKVYPFLSQWAKENSLSYSSGDAVCRLSGSLYTVWILDNPVMTGNYIIDVSETPHKIKQPAYLTRIPSGKPIDIIKDRGQNPYLLSSYLDGSFGKTGLASIEYTLTDLRTLAKSVVMGSYFLSAPQLKLYEAGFENGAGNGGCEVPGLRAMNKSLRYYEHQALDLDIRDANGDKAKDIVLSITEKNCKTSKIEHYQKVYYSYNGNFDTQVPTNTRKTIQTQ